MSELSPEKAREIIDKPRGPIYEWVQDADEICLARGYLEREAQLRPLIDSLVGALEKVDIELGKAWEEEKKAEHLMEMRRTLRDGLLLTREALTLAHKAGFGKEKEKE